MLSNVVELHFRRIQQRCIDDTDAKNGEADSQCWAGDGDQSPWRRYE